MCGCCCQEPPPRCGMASAASMPRNDEQVPGGDGLFAFCAGYAARCAGSAAARASATRRHHSAHIKNRLHHNGEARSRSRLKSPRDDILATKKLPPLWRPFYIFVWLGGACACKISSWKRIEKTIKHIVRPIGTSQRCSVDVRTH